MSDKCGAGHPARGNYLTPLLHAKTNGLLLAFEVDSDRAARDARARMARPDPTCLVSRQKVVSGQLLHAYLSLNSMWLAGAG